MALEGWGYREYVMLVRQGETIEQERVSQETRRETAQANREVNEAPQTPPDGPDQGFGIVGRKNLERER